MILAPQTETGRWQATAFTVLVHGFLLAFLVVGVQWKRTPPATVQVELWSERPSGKTVAVVPPQPVRPPDSKPEPKPDPVPPAQATKPEPVVPSTPEKTAPVPKARPDITIRDDKKPEPIKAPRREVKPRPRTETPRITPPSRPVWERALRNEEIARAIAQEKGELAAAASGQRALASWIDRISAKIRGNTVRPQNLQGNPVALFSIELLVTGQIHRVVLKRSSGHRAWDEATERAIWKSSPLPKPENEAVFRRDFDLEFRPDEERR